MSSSEILIIGAGLAGLTAGIHLSKSGFNVTVVEKHSFSRHKVCGEYISNEVLPYMQWLGLDITLLKPTNITNISFSAINGNVIHGKLPLGGFGISRFAFDYLLYQKAIHYGCTFVEQTVSQVTFDQGRFDVALSDGVHISSDIVLGAYGKRSNLDQKLHRTFIKQKSPWLAVKAHYKGEFPNNTVGLHNFKGGYCGVSKVENEIINICYLADYDSFKQYKNITEFQNAVVSENPNLKRILENSTMIFEAPLTISQISFEQKESVENHILMIGDTAGLIHPLCGNGMAMAIHSAKIASEQIINFKRGIIDSRAALEAAYKKEWDGAFKRRMTMGRVLASLLRREKLSAMLTGILSRFPALLQYIISKTHGQPITVADD
jgi:hypothetical protein